MFRKEVELKVTRPMRKLGLKVYTHVRYMALEPGPDRVMCVAGCVPLGSSPTQPTERGSWNWVVVENTSYSILIKLSRRFCWSSKVKNCR